MTSEERCDERHSAVTADSDQATTAIIGAGLAGLTAARELSQRGESVVVFDKGRGPGGRTSHRRQQGFIFDHGAQYFTARDSAFRRQVQTWLASGVVAPLEPRVWTFNRCGAEIETNAGERFVGIPGMNAMAVDLARGVEVRSSVEVRTIDARQDGLHLCAADNRVFGPFARVIVTTPAPQAAALVARVSSALGEKAAKVRMLPCWTALLAFDEPLDLSFDAAFVRNESPLAWVARNTAKPQRDSTETWTLHANASWSTQQIERDKTEVAATLTAAFRELVNSFIAPAFTTAHRWRYAFVDRPVDAPCLVDDQQSIVLAGDWCLGPRVEAAYLSGRAAAEAAIQM